MSKALPLDLRIRVLKAVAEGASRREVATRFSVTPASVSRWRTLQRRQGDAPPARWAATAGPPASRRRPR